MEYFSKKYPLKNEIVHVKLANKRKSGIIQEEEWVDIVKHMYEDDDALQIISRMLEFSRQLAAEAGEVEQPEEEVDEGAMQEEGDEANKTGSVFSKHRRRIDIYYEDFIKVVQGCQLEAHERFLSKFFQLFRRFDSDHNGILDENEFRQLILAIGGKSESQVRKLCRHVDPTAGTITYSECVALLQGDIAELR